MPPSWLDLHEGESIRMTIHPSRWLLFRQVVQLGVPAIVITAIYVTGVIEGFQVPVVDVPIDLALFGILPLLALPLIREMILRWMTLYVITDEQVWKKTGIISREIDPLELEQIVDIEIRQGKLDRVLGKGEVAISNAATGAFDMHLKHSPNPHEVAGELRRAKKDAPE